MELERIVAGRPVLRRLGDGERSSIWLGTGDVVLKVLAPDGPPAALAHEVEALERAAGDHVVALLDVAADDDGEVLVMPRLPRGSLADLLAARATLDAGEAVTVLVPIARALARMHAAGAAHAALTASAVRFSDDGAPVLCGFGGAVLFAPGLPEVVLEREPGVVADREALARLAAVVLERVAGSRAPAAQRLAGELSSELVDLEERTVRGLFELAAARPVRFEPDPLDVGGAPARVGGSAAPPILDDPAPDGMRAHAARLLAAGPGPFVAAGRRLLRARWEQTSPIRRRGVVAAVAAGAALVLLVALVPNSSTAEGTGQTVPGVTESTSAAPESAHGPETPTPVHGDDPVAALVVLLDRRERCLRQLAEGCLAEVVEPGSSAEAEDLAVLTAIMETGAQPAPVSPIDASIVDEYGGMVLVTLAPDSEPASVLLVRTEAGWRIRDYLTAAAG